jgi:hypothetical protein
MNCTRWSPFSEASCIDASSSLPLPPDRDGAMLGGGAGPAPRCRFDLHATETRLWHSKRRIFALRVPVN